ncbi:MAG: RnfABCDGE type electron transport complex subunit B [Spirochaetota bacterium]|nr:RnfABCDGE type electron transport complex subunit B [Spirochaetota bacterium]
MIEIIVPSISSVISITAIGVIFGFVLSYAKLKLKVDKDPRFALVLEALPGVNCGACGEAGCAGYASNIIEGSVSLNLCPVGGPDVTNEICDIMGVEAEIAIPKKARVCCQGSRGATKTKFIYDGPKSCLAAGQIRGGFKVCKYGCLGLGDCVNSCPFGAIRILESGLPSVDWEECTGCGNCVEACPRGIITLIDEGFGVHILCNNKEKAPIMKKGCSVGCIACKRCIKACKEVFTENPDIETAIDVIDFLAVIDYDKCINCGKCVDICPQNVINFDRVTISV